MMTHPFALTIDDLAYLETVDENSLEGGAMASAKRTGLSLAYREGGCDATYIQAEQGCQPHPLPITYRFREVGGPFWEPQFAV